MSILQFPLVSSTKLLWLFPVETFNLRWIIVSLCKTEPPTWTSMACLTQFLHSVLCKCKSYIHVIWRKIWSSHHVILSSGKSAQEKCRHRKDFVSITPCGCPTEIYYSMISMSTYRKSLSLGLLVTLQNHNLWSVACSKLWKVLSILVLLSCIFYPSAFS